MRAGLPDFLRRHGPGRRPRTEMRLSWESAAACIRCTTPGCRCCSSRATFSIALCSRGASHSFAQGPAHLYATNVVMLVAVSALGLRALPAALRTYRQPPTFIRGHLHGAPQPAGHRLRLSGTIRRSQEDSFSSSSLDSSSMPTGARFWPAFGYGVLAGYLPWLHVRFGYAAIVAGRLMTVGRMRSARRAVVGFCESALRSRSVRSACTAITSPGASFRSRYGQLMLAAEPDDARGASRRCCVASSASGWISTGDWSRMRRCTCWRWPGCGRCGGAAVAWRCW